MKRVPVGILILLLNLITGLAQADVGTSFTYQGQLFEAGAPVTGSYQFRITPYTAAVNGSAMAAPVTTGPVAVSDGVFTIVLDFGSAVFLDDPVWLEIEVDGPTTDFVLLSPRQAVTPTPFAISASSVSSDGVDSTALQDGSVTSAKVDAGQVQLRVATPCAAGSAIQSIAQDGSSSCVPVGDSDWATLLDGRLQSEVGVRIQPSVPTDYPFTVRHNSTTLSPQVGLTESQANDFTRLSFYNDSDFSSFWTLAGRIGGAGPEDHIFNLFHSTGGDLLSLRGDRRVGIGNSNPDAPLMIQSQGNWNSAEGNGRGDVHIGTSAMGLSFGVALGGGGAGASRIWTKGGAEQLFVGSATHPDMLSISGDKVGIATTSPTAVLDVNGDFRVRGLSHGDAANRTVEVAQDGTLSAVPSSGPAGYTSYNKKELSFASSNSLDIPVRLPDGVYWTEFTVWYIDNNATWNIVITPVQQTLAAGTEAGFAGFTSAGDSPSIRTSTVINGGNGILIDNSTYSYFLTTAIATGAYPSLQIIGMRVKYE